MASQLVIISGPPGAGKTATAEALCQRYDRMLHVDMDALRGMLRMGLLRDDAGGDDARTQHLLFIDAACDLASRFLQAGYGVVIDGKVTADDLDRYRDRLAEVDAIAHFVVLLPAVDVLKRRARSPHHAGTRDAYAAWSDVCAIDPGDLAPDLVADRVMAAAAQGIALL